MKQEPTRRSQVGDTLTVVHRISAPPGALVQARAPEDTTLATLTGPADISREGDSVRIAYSIAVWNPGQHELVIPGAIVVSATGVVDTLPDARLQLDVQSVLPAGASPDSLQPQAARPWVSRAEVSWLPLAVLLVPLLLSAALLALVWRRRGPPAEVAKAVKVMPPDPVRLARWIEAGEPGLVVDHLLTALANRDDAAEWRSAVASVRFDASASSHLVQLAHEGLALLTYSVP
jgi:hypothetical protein